MAYYDQQALTDLQLSPTNELPERLILDLDGLRNLPVPTQRALLRLAIVRFAPTLQDLTFDHLMDLCAQIQTAVSGGPHPLLGDVCWSVAGATTDNAARLSLHWRTTLPFLPDHLLLAAGEQLVLPEVELGQTVCQRLHARWQLTITKLARADLPADWYREHAPWRAFFDADQVSELLLAAATPGRQFAPFGLAGHHKMLGDFFTDQKIPVALRNCWPLIIEGHSDAVLWVCGLRTAHQAQITAQTALVLCIEIEPADGESVNE
ncbi:MAG: tRNA lysidine(34) synthetase TilS [Caldilineaceae bacterium]